MHCFWVISFQKVINGTQTPCTYIGCQIKAAHNIMDFDGNSQNQKFFNPKNEIQFDFFYVLKTYFEVQLFKPYKRWRRRRWYGKQGIERCAKLPNLRLSHNSTHLALTHCSFLSSCHAIHTVTKFQKPSLVFRYFKGQKCFCQWSMRIFRQNKWLKRAGRIFVR